MGICVCPLHEGSLHYHVCHHVRKACDSGGPLPDLDLPADHLVCRECLTAEVRELLGLTYTSIIDTSSDESLEESAGSAVLGISSFEAAQLAALAATERLTLAMRAQANELRGDFARQAAERRARLSGSSIGQPLFSQGARDDDPSRLSGGTFTTITRPRATADGRLLF